MKPYKRNPETIQSVEELDCGKFLVTSKTEAGEIKRRAYKSPKNFWTENIKQTPTNNITEAIKGVSQLKPGEVVDFNVRGKQNYGHLVHFYCVSDLKHEELDIYSIQINQGEDSEEKTLILEEDKKVWASPKDEEEFRFYRVPFTLVEKGDHIWLKKSYICYLE